jgi:hypothetical protein
MVPAKLASTILLTVAEDWPPVVRKITVSPDPGGVLPPTVVQLPTADQFWFAPPPPDQVVFPAACTVFAQNKAIAPAMMATVEKWLSVAIGGFFMALKRPINDGSKAFETKLVH